MQTLFEAAGGADGMRRLADAWHARVLADPIVSHAFSHGFSPDHTERLAAYLGEALGGPPAYTGAYGTHASVVRLHSGNGLHEEMDRRAIASFEAALADVGLPVGEAVGAAVLAYFSWATTGLMDAYPASADDVPADLPMPCWSWDGRVDPSQSVDPSMG